MWQVRQRRSIGVTRITLLFALAATVAPLSALVATRGSSPPAQVAPLPAQLSDAEFWKLVSDISEPGGYFRIVDNFTSNEREVGQLYSMLRERGTSGGVYLGVGPEQNFTYIAAIRPAMAFIIDIRRQAVMQHLMFKAMFELSNDRADFISMLFGKPRPAGLDSTTSIQAIWDAFWPVISDSALSAQNYARIVEHLTRTRGFAFTPDESAQLKHVYDSFYWFGPEISTRGTRSQRGWGNNSTFADLTGYSYDASGEPRSFLSSEENFRYVKSLHARNLIVPVSGDFGGPKAIRAIGEWLHRHGGVVSAFYVSNVEQYLFQDGKQDAFYANVAALPLSEQSVFIRPYSLRRYGVTESLCPITPFIGAAKNGLVYNYGDALACIR
ncbi:MAG TPA: hypothetical protein VF178_01920 [Gemmatimonadaceae bacterium]